MTAENSVKVTVPLTRSWAASGLTVREYLRQRFGVVSARVGARQARKDAHRLTGLLAESRTTITLPQQDYSI